MEKKYYCPTCNGELEMLSGCGAVGYFCNHCRKLVSRQKMLSEPGEQQATEEPSNSENQSEKQSKNQSELQSDNQQSHLKDR